MKSLCVTLLAAYLGLTALSAREARIVAIENKVEATKAEGAWSPARAQQVLHVDDRIRTLRKSRATVQLTGLYSMRMEQLTTVEISPSLLDDSKPRLDLGAGALFIFSREQNGEIDIKTPAANGALRGTQLYVRVEPNGRTLYQVLEGRVELSNTQGRLAIAAGEAAEAAPGTAPRRTAMVEASHILQWALYYPAVIDPQELRHQVNDAERRHADNALQAYEQGDLLGALDLFQGGPKAFEAALLLSVGRLDEARPLLASLPSTLPLRLALERLLLAVQHQDARPWDLHSLTSASQAMAESYHRQSRDDLEGARDSARLAVKLAPNNGYAWTRLGEMEFSFGRSARAQEALERALQLTPRHAQAHALHGFVLSARNRIAQAQQAFERATQLDGALGNGWLGLGLTKIKQGHLAEGRADLQTAATVEPLMSLFHSYLGKAFSVEGRGDDAQKDLALARQLDANDPTPWFYSALEKQQHNRSNEAIDDLQKSIELNDNRRVYRSGLLLDQDRAVRSANLAAIYRNNGMQEVALREAARAVDSDFTNSSAHLLLANAFHGMRDPQRIMLRHETAWFNELLLANLLSPVGGGPLSQYVSQQEYSKLLEADGIGASLVGEYRGTGEWRNSASVFGTQGNWGWGLDYSMRDTHGNRPNHEANLQELFAQIKWQPGSDDTLYFLSKWSTFQQGDLFETFNNRTTSPGYKSQGDQEPGMLLAGWNHRWAPGSHTLLIGGRLSASQLMSDPRANQMLIERDASVLRPSVISVGPGSDEQFSNPAYSTTLAADGRSLVHSPQLLAAIQPLLNSGAVRSLRVAPFSMQTRNQAEIYFAELMHLQRISRHQLLAGARYQEGEFSTHSEMSVLRPTIWGLATPAFRRTDTVDFQRLSLYSYDYWQPHRWLTLMGGMTWDRMHHPVNFRHPPTSSEGRTDERLSFKSGWIFNPSRRVQLRGAFTQALGGASFDENIRLEPAQVAGFTQNYRTLLSENMPGIGSLSAPRLQSAGLSLEGSLPTRTWWGLTGNLIEQKVDRSLGTFTGFSSTLFPSDPAYFPGITTQRLTYREQSLQATVNQLLNRRWALGAVYRMTQSSLRTAMPELESVAHAQAMTKDHATLHEVGLSANFNSPCGLFARVEGNAFSQNLADGPNAGSPARQGDAFCQVNAFAGYRFHRNLCELSLGVLNLGNRDYQLSPLNPWWDLPRERTLVARFRISF